jgi:hypothetical protein
LILRRVFGLATASALAKAWEKKSRKWFTLAGVLILFQMFDARAARKPSPKKSAK